MLITPDPIQRGHKPFRKGLIENGIVGVINRRNGCGSTVVAQRLWLNGCA